MLFETPIYWAIASRRLVSAFQSIFDCPAWNSAVPMSWHIGMHPPPLVSLDQATVQSFANQKLNRLGQRQPDSELVLQREEVNEGEITLDVYVLTEDKIP